MGDASQPWPGAVVLQQELVNDGEHLCLNALAHQNVKVSCGTRRGAAATHTVEEWGEEAPAHTHDYGWAD